MSKQVLVDIRASGIRNISKYFEDLAKADLYNVSKLSSQEQTMLTKLSGELERWRAEWTAYTKRKVTK